MNVLHLIDSDGLYGAEHVLLNLLPHLQKIGIQVALVCLSPIDAPGGDIGRELEKAGVTVAYVNERKKISLRGMSAIYRVIKDVNPDVVHVHGYKATILGGLIARFSGVPFISTYHGEARQRPELALYARIEAIVLRGGAHVIAVSDRIRCELIARGINEGRISVGYNGVEDPVRVHGVLNDNGWGRGRSKKIVCIGRLVPLKRFELVIDAISALSEQHPDVHLLIAGSGPLESDLKQKVGGLGLNDRIHVLGHVKDTDALYRDASLFVLASTTEGAPIALIEAMAFSVPIITTAVGAIPEMIRHGKDAYVVPPDNLEALTEAIDFMMSHPEQGELMGAAGRKTFLQKFNAHVMVDHYLASYKNILKESE